MKIIKLKKKTVTKFIPSPEWQMTQAERDAKKQERVDKQQRKEEFAQQLRENPTASEKIFLEMLEQLGIKFVFQPVMYGYIPDFFFPNHGRRIVEIDGSSHAGKQSYDQRRNKVFKDKGHKVLHIRASRVFWDLECIKWEVKAFLSGQAGSYKKQHKVAKKKRPPKPDFRELRYIDESINAQMDYAIWNDK